MWWCLLLALVLLWNALAVIWFCQQRRIALVVIHPMNIGASERETHDRLMAFQCAKRGRSSREQIGQVLDKSAQYRAIFVQCISLLQAYRVVLIEERRQMASSISLLCSMTPRWRRALTQRVDVVSRPGRATPEEGSWNELSLRLHSLGIRRLRLVGCFLGVKDHELISPERMYFCVNDAYFELRASGLFDEVLCVEDFCYTEVVYEIPKGVIARKSIPKPRDRKRRDKK